MLLARTASLGLLALFLTACMEDKSLPAPEDTTPTASLSALGQALFADTSLSRNGTQSCQSCHTPAAAFSDPAHTAVSVGALPGTSGSRNSPMASYTMFVPPLQYNATDAVWMGGLFLDGRADTLEAQAAQPFLNANEMANSDIAEVINHLRASPNANAFRTEFGADSLDPSKEEQAYAQITQALAAFERTSTVNPFSSKFDAYLAGRATLSAQEQEGMAAFVRKDKGNCAACHVMSRDAEGRAPQLTDFTYDNLGLPANPLITNTTMPDGQPEKWGVYNTLRNTIGEASAETEKGKFRVPSLRNVAITAPYMHNGVFTTLRESVEFYNSRDTQPGRWGEAEVPETVNHAELGDLKLSNREIDAIVAFMNTLTDGYYTP